ncbi:MAG: SCO family protein [Aeromonas sp.]
MLTRRTALMLLGMGSLAALTSSSARSEQTALPRLVAGLPNVALKNQWGETKYFVDDLAKDHLLIMNMMYTDCEQSCPLATKNLIHVAQLLKAHIKRPYVLCSLSLKPAEDDVAQLAHYTQTHHLAKEWQFLTGEPKHVLMLRRALGFYDVDPNVDSDALSHTAMLRLGDLSRQRWSMMPALADPAQILAAVAHLGRQPLTLSS